MPFPIIASLVLIWTMLVGGFTASFVNTENNTYNQAITAELGGTPSTDGSSVLPPFLKQGLDSMKKLSAVMSNSNLAQGGAVDTTSANGVGQSGAATADGGSLSNTIGNTSNVDASVANINAANSAALLQGKQSLVVVANTLGTVTSSPAGISCGSACFFPYAKDTSVTLTAKPSAGATFTGWTGACTNTTGTCTVKLSKMITVGTNFKAQALPQSVYKTTDVVAHATESNCWIIVAGKVYSVSAYISMHPGGKTAITGQCGKDATIAFNTKGYGKPHSPSAWSLLGTYLIGTVSTAPVVVPAGSFGLTVTLAGTGSGTVTSAPLGINCGIVCTTPYVKGTTVTLIATPKTGDTFTGWTGACTNTTSTCTVTVSAATAVTATFKAAVVVPVVQGTYKATDVVTHSTAADCWFIVSGKIYSVGSYISMHPGGATVIVNQCGKDATTAFTTKGIGSSHSVSAWSLLNTFLVGTLAVDVIPAGSFGLTVALAGTGSGSVTSAPTGINCGIVCTSPYVKGTSVTLTAVPTGSDTFTGWTGACTNTSGTCTVAMNQATTVTATFKAPVIIQGSYSAAQVATHSTAGDCWIIVSDKVYSVGSYIAMHPGGAMVIVNQCGKDATVAFNTKGTGSSHSTNAWTLLGTFLVGTYTGTITPTPTPTPVVPVVTPTPSATYTAADVALHSTQSNCWIIVSNNVYSVGSYIAMHPGGAVVINNQCGKESTTAFTTKGTGSSHSVSAWSLLGTFIVGTLSTAPVVVPAGSFTLSVAPAGTGTGSVTSAPTGIDCGNTCSANFTKGTSVTLTAAATNGGTFSGWTGACTGTASTCTVTVNAATSVGANFTAAVVAPVTQGTYTAADVALHSTQSNCWIIVSNNVYSVGSYIAMHPGGAVVINNQCGKESTTAFTTKGTGSSHSVSAWSLLGTFIVGTLSTAPVVVPAGSFTLSVAPAGTGTGSVTSAPTGIDCGNTCSANFTKGTSVTLTAAATNGGTFSGWTGACTGTASTCTVTVNAATSVGANFTAAVVAPVTQGTYTAADVALHSTQSNCWIIVSNNVYSVGSYIAMHPGGAVVINNQCGKESTTAFTTKGTGSSHSVSAWSLLGTFIVGTLSTAPVVVPAGSFTLSVAPAGTGTGSVTSAPTGIDCGNTCSANFTKGTSVTLTAAATNGGTFSGWTGACTGTASTCTVTVNAATSVGANFTAAPVVVVPPGSYTVADVALHSTPANCWIIVSNNVYSVSSYIAMHPGGAAVINNQCGKESTTIFTNKGGIGTHSTNAWTLLGTFLIGTITTGPVVPVGSYTLTTAPSGTGSGSITSVPTGINCGNVCSYIFTGGTAVMLSAVPASGSTFTGWTGACTGTGSCIVTMSAAATVGVTFTSNVAVQTTFTVAEVAAHNSSTNCWLIVSGSVYSVAGYIASHPGGKTAIINQCGKDATNYLAGTVGGHKHSTSAYSILNGMSIGTVNTGTVVTPPPVTTPVNGACGTSNATAFTAAPTTNFCTSGTASAVTGSGPWAWTCDGSNGGTSATCGATVSTVTTNGSCGSANGTAVTTAPTTNLCTAGLAGTVAGTGPWTWSCAGINGGTTASCTATKSVTLVNGNCGTANGTSRTSAPSSSTSLCSAGTATTVSGTGPWTWSCNGANGGSTASCTASVTVTNGSCGSSNGITTAQTPTSGLCTSGTASTVTGSGPWAWTCASSNGGTTASCTATNANGPYTVAQVATHTSSSNCWLIIGTNVYSVSSYISSHPGGRSKITNQCGKDASTAFATKSKTPATAHSSSAWSLLGTYLIGAVTP